MHSIVAREPLEVVAIAFTVLEPASNGIENVLVMTDVNSKFMVSALRSSLPDTLRPMKIL